MSVGYRQRRSDEIGHENVLFLIVAVIAVRPQTANRELCTVETRALRTLRNQKKSFDSIFSVIIINYLHGRYKWIAMD